MPTFLVSLPHAFPQQPAQALPQARAGLQGGLKPLPLFSPLPSTLYTFPFLGREQGSPSHPGRSPQTVAKGHGRLILRVRPPTPALGLDPEQLPRPTVSCAPRSVASQGPERCLIWLGHTALAPSMKRELCFGFDQIPGERKPPSSLCRKEAPIAVAGADWGSGRVGRFRAVCSGFSST